MTEEKLLENYVADKLRISLDELHSLVNGENKKYSDYNNQFYLYNFGAAVTKRIPGMNSSGAKR